MDIPRLRAFQLAASAVIALSLFGRRVPGLPLGVSADLYPLALVGLLVAAFAFTSFMFSSQKVLRPQP